MAETLKSPEGKPGALARVTASAAKNIARRRVFVPTVSLLTLAGAYAAALGLHSLLVKSGSNDAWAAAIGAVATVVLVLVTALYVYLTYGLLEAQRSSARTAAWETSMRDLSVYMARMTRKNSALRKAEELFPVDTSGPLNALTVIELHKGVEKVWRHLFEVSGLLPEDLRDQVLNVALLVVQADQELGNLTEAQMNEAELASAARPHRDPTWLGARHCHEASDDPLRSESWDDVLAGKKFKVAMKSWERLSDDLDERLTH